MVDGGVRMVGAGSLGWIRFLGRLFATLGGGEIGGGCRGGGIFLGLPFFGIRDRGLGSWGGGWFR